MGWCEWGGWLHFFCKTWRTSGLDDIQPKDLRIVFPNLFTIPCLQPSTRNLPPHSRAILRTSGSCQDLALKGCSNPPWWSSWDEAKPPESPISCSWISRSLHPFFRILRPCSTLASKLCRCSSVRWFAFCMIEKGKQGGAKCTYRGRTVRIRCAAFRNPARVERSNPLCTPRRKARPPNRSTASANGESQGAQTSMRSTRECVRASKFSMVCFSKLSCCSFRTLPCTSARNTTSQGKQNPSSSVLKSLPGTALESTESTAGCAFELFATEPLSSWADITDWWSCPYSFSPDTVLWWVASESSNKGTSLESVLTKRPFKSSLFPPKAKRGINKW